jgi:ketosteroid isomerase-like protein
VSSDVEQRLRALESRAALSDLVHRYAVALDDRDYPALSDLFTEGAAFAHPAGQAKGRDEVVRMFSQRMSAYGPTFHYGHSLGLDELSDSSARGVLTAHAELVINGRLHIVALRYADRYERGADERWRFASRAQSFLYVLDHDQLASQVATADRVRWPGLPARAADLGPGT